jgi:hypothetical protein
VDAEHATALEIRVLGPLRIDPPPRVVPKVAANNRAAGMLLALLAVDPSRDFPDLYELLCGNRAELRGPKGPVRVNRNKLEKVIGHARHHLGPTHKHHLENSDDRVVLHETRVAADGSRTEVLRDAKEFFATSAGDHPDRIRSAVELVVGELAATLLVGKEAHQEVLDQLRSRQRAHLTELLVALGARQTDVQSLLTAAAASGGRQALVVLDSLESICLTERRTYEQHSWREVGVTPASVAHIPYPERIPRDEMDGLLDEGLQRAAAARSATDSAQSIVDHPRFVVLHGPSLYGKTRALHEAVLRNEVLRRTGTRIAAGFDAVAQDLSSLRQRDEPWLLWIDDIDGYCAFEHEHGGVTAARISAALNANPALIVLATAGGKGAQRIGDRSD